MVTFYLLLLLYIFEVALVCTWVVARLLNWEGAILAYRQATKCERSMGFISYGASLTGCAWFCGDLGINYLKF